MKCRRIGRKLVNNKKTRMKGIRFESAVKEREREIQRQITGHTERVPKNLLEISNYHYNYYYIKEETAIFRFIHYLF